MERNEIVPAPTENESDDPFAGPPTYANWKAAIRERPVLAIEEFPLFTDARITGEITCGPYQFINTVPFPQPGLVKTAIVLRCSGYLQWATPDMTKTNTDRYHGGSFPEEIAALASLALGVRLRAGSATRIFWPGGDPMGTPTEWGLRRMTGTVGASYSPWRLPGAAEGEHSLDLLEVLNRLPVMPSESATSLVRAARLYQDSLWLIESEASLAWLMLVSALETAANQWQKELGTPEERLRASRPELHQYLANLGQDVPSVVAQQIADTLGSGKKFVDFVMKFLPPPPTNRPALAYQFHWEQTEMRRSLRKIYGFRSDALHDGKPFPAPMCAPPFTEPRGAMPSEKPPGLATSSGEGVWVAKDVPMLFHLFEYITRHAILDWWRQGAPGHNGTSDPRASALPAASSNSG